MAQCRRVKEETCLLLKGCLKTVQHNSYSCFWVKKLWIPSYRLCRSMLITMYPINLCHSGTIEYVIKYDKRIPEAPGWIKPNLHACESTKKYGINQFELH